MRYASREWADSKSDLRRSTIRAYARLFFRFAIRSILPLAGGLYLATAWQTDAGTGAGQDPVLHGLSIARTGALLLLGFLLLAFLGVVVWALRALDSPRFAIYHSPRRILFDEETIEERYSNGVATIAPWREIDRSWHAEGERHLLFAGRNQMRVPDGIFDPETQARFQEVLARHELIRKL